MKALFDSEASPYQKKLSNLNLKFLKSQLIKFSRMLEPFHISSYQCPLLEGILRKQSSEIILSSEVVSRFRNIFSYSAPSHHSMMVICHNFFFIILSSWRAQIIPSNDLSQTPHDNFFIWALSEKGVNCYSSIQLNCAQHLQDEQVGKKNFN